ncbi:MAG: mechanosensitive ion channel [Alphaproteobacteria bacterium]|nr:mechanosensitive ion channel [Alphaproteobacteria bacterium]
MQLFEQDSIQKLANAVLEWMRSEVLVWGTLYQIAGVLVALVLARVLYGYLRTGVVRFRVRFGEGGFTNRALGEIEEQAFLLTWLVLSWIVQILAEGTKWGDNVIQAVVSLLAAWVAVQFISLFIRNRGSARLVGLIVWVLAALNILDLLDPTIKLLDAAAIQLGGFRLSVVVVIKGLMLFAVLLWVAMILSHTIEKRVATSEVLSPSVRVLTSQFAKIILVTLAVVVALASVGIDLTALAVFTGALGVGAGFGLQKVVANLFSGIMLLLDRSIKPGDVIAVGGTYGWVNFMGARYLSLITRDGTEHLIPNENLITNAVENWSYSNEFLRLKIPIGISYKSDLGRAIELVLEAAAEVERVLDEPQSACLVKGFGDSSVDLEARIWINDPRNGVSNVKSQVLLNVWNKFHEHGVEIPFPQRDLHVKSGLEGFTGPQELGNRDG